MSFPSSIAVGLMPTGVGTAAGEAAKVSGTGNQEFGVTLQQGISYMLYLVTADAYVELGSGSATASASTLGPFPEKTFIPFKCPIGQDKLAVFVGASDTVTAFLWARE